MIQAKAKTIIAFNAMWAFASDLIEAYGPNGTNILTDAQLVSFQEAAGTCHDALRDAHLPVSFGDVAVRATLDDGKGRLVTVDGVYNTAEGSLILAPRGEDERAECKWLTYLAAPGTEGLDYTPAEPIDLSTLTAPGQWNINVPRVLLLRDEIHGFLQQHPAQRPRG